MAKKQQQKTKSKMIVSPVPAPLMRGELQNGTKDFMTQQLTYVPSTTSRK